MDTMKIQLSVLWIALMLTYLLGDVMRIFSGDFIAGKIRGKEITQGMWLGLAIVMVIPVIMAILSIALGNPVNRWLNLIIPVVFFVFNIIGLPTYHSLYDKFLIIVGLGINILTVWFAWTWH